MPRDAKVFADVARLNVRETAPKPSTAASSEDAASGSGGGGGQARSVTQVTNKGVEEAGPGWCDVWDATVGALQNDLQQLSAADSKTTSVLVYLYNRLGYDCGCFARGLHKVSE